MSSLESFFKEEICVYGFRVTTEPQV